MQETSLVAVAKKVAMVTIFALLCRVWPRNIIQECFFKIFYASPLAIYCLFFVVLLLKIQLHELEHYKLCSSHT